MGWTGFPVQAGDDFLQVEFLQQFVDAINERKAIDFEATTPIDDVVAGSHVTRVAGQPTLRGFQNWAFGRAYEWMDSINHPTGFDHATVTWESMTFGARTGSGDSISNQRARAFQMILGQDHFARRYPRTIASADDNGEAGWRAYLGSQNSTDTGSSHGSTHVIYAHDGATWSLAADQASGPDVLEGLGLMIRGDYVGPWIVNELQTVISALRWSWREGLEYERRRGGHSGQTPPPNFETCAEARAHAEAEWADDELASALDLNHLYEIRQMEEEEFDAQVSTVDAFRSIASLGGPFDCAVNVALYALPHTPPAEPGPGIYDAAHVGFAEHEEGEWIELTSEEIAAQTGGEARWVANDMMPPPPDCPAIGEHVSRGFRVAITGQRERVLIRGDVAGGFEYL